jgi:hypothetical protein
MGAKRTIQGRGALTCADAQTSVIYKLDLFTDHTGNLTATGLLYNVDLLFTLAAFHAGSPCRLVLQDNLEIWVDITPHGDGIVEVENHGPVPDLTA